MPFHADVAERTFTDQRCDTFVRSPPPVTVASAGTLGLVDAPWDSGPGRGLAVTGVEVTTIG